MNHTSDMRTATLILGSLLLLSASEKADAGNGPRHRNEASKSAQARAAEAKKACAAGEYRAGVDILAALYVETDQPDYIFNQGRCYEQNGRYDDAILRFREYLRKARDASGKDKAEAELHISDCRRLQAEEAGKVATQPSLPVMPPPGPPVPQAGTMPPTYPQVAIQQAVPQEAPQRSNGVALRTAGIIAGSVGIASVATGIILNVKANHLIDEVNTHFDPGMDSTSRSYQHGAWICYGLGGAALVTGVVLYLVGHAKGRLGRDAVAFSPALTPNGAALLVSGPF